MFEWLILLPQWFQIFFATSLGLLFWFIIFKLFKKGFSFAYGKFSLNSAKNKSNKPHIKCEHANDIIYLLTKQQEFILKKIEIKSDTLPRQMNYAEERASYIIGIMQDIYIKLLQNFGEKHPTEVYSFKAYQMILEALKTEMLGKIRMAFRRNRFSEMTEENFTRYAKDKIEVFVTESSDFLTNKYFCNDVITREDLYEANNSNVSEIRESILTVFMRARSISIEQLKDIEELDNLLTEIIDEFIGPEYKIS